MPNDNAIPATTVPIHFDLSSSHRYLGGEDYRPTRRATTAYTGEAPAPWGVGSIIALIFACVLGLTLLTGLGLLVANGGSFSCDSACWLAKKQMKTDEQATLRAIANSDANARAGFGNDDETTKQKAVLPRAKIEYREEAPNITIQRAAATVTGCTSCGGGVTTTNRGVATLDGPGRCNMHGDHEGELGYVWADKRCHHLPPTSS